VFLTTASFVLYASTPLFAITSNVDYPSTNTVPPSGSIQVKYQVTNKAKRAFTLAMTPINHVTQLTQGAGLCGSVFTLNPQQSCTLLLEIQGSSLTSSLISEVEVCPVNSLFGCYQTNEASKLRIFAATQALIQLSATPGILTLQRDYDTAQYLTVTNTSRSAFGTAQNVQAILPPDWTDVTQDASQCIGLSAGESCQLAFTAGSNLYSSADVTIQGTNTAATTVTMSVGASAVLSASLQTLALSVNDPSFSALTGNPRQLMIINTSNFDAVNVGYDATGLPSDASVSPTSCGTIPANGGTCTLTITPGATPTTTAVGLPIYGPNTQNTVTPTINILTYGSVFQGGYVFSVDDSYSDYPETVSIGGAVAAQTNQVNAGVNGLPWASNGLACLSSAADSCDNVSYVTILGIDESSTQANPSPQSPEYSNNTPPFYLSCNGLTEGLCDTVNIVSYYQSNRAFGG
ncbi:MAG: hypothetical protein B7X00_01220, partial [Legionella sp. 21-45-4]